MTVTDLQPFVGTWIMDSQEVKEVNQNLGEWFDSYFMVEPADGGRSGCYEVYGCDSNIPWIDARVKGPFAYPR